MIIPGFKPASELQIVRRIVCNIQGLQKSGKSHLSLTAPKPLAYINLDKGLEGVIHKFPDRDKILVKEIPVPKVGAGQAEYKRAWNEAISAYDAALAHPEIKTVVVDTGTEMYDLCRLNYLGQLSSVPPTKYAEVNNEMKALVRRGYDSGKDIIFLHQEKESYENNKKAGLDRAGWGEMDYAVQVNIKCLYEKSTFQATILTCRHKPELNNSSFLGPFLNFEFIKNQILQDM